MSPPIVTQPPDFRAPISQACTQAQFETPEFRFWCREIREPFRYHRKLWEYCYLLQVLATHGMIAPGRRGLGFGVGRETTVAVLASRGVSVVASDADPVVAQAEWVETGQHASVKDDLNERWICPPDLFDGLVDFRIEDMNAISPDLAGFDFAWSLCAFEHLGTIEKGLAFVRNSLACVKPGGLIVHTTELNIGSDEATLDKGPIVLFRRKDFTGLAEALRAEGHEVTLNFTLGDMDLDRYVDEEPYTARRHLRLKLGGFVTTSFGFVVRKAG
jgi:2-polyprenyl-3-methyl-5-hydroxy-6-metoxy-1,4-benzoquinol methylase